jgi:hypothetical protein
MLLNLEQEFSGFPKQHCKVALTKRQMTNVALQKEQAILCLLPAQYAARCSHLLVALTPRQDSTRTCS